MCQLTLVDFDDKRLSKFVIRPLTEINTLGINSASNHDGFGYVRFTDLDTVSKSNKAASIWWIEHAFDFRRKFRNTNGIYHVRACSHMNKSKTEDEHSHPFFTDNLILAHNGTLRVKHDAPDKDIIEKLVDDDTIDSENFLKVLDYYVEEDNSHAHLVADNIQTAVDQWSGDYAFLMLDKRNPKSVFIAKDDTKRLHKAVFKIRNKRVGIIINTMPFELRYVGMTLCQYAEALDIKLTFEIEELDDMNVWVYERDTYFLNDPIMTIEKPKVKPIHHGNPNWRQSSAGKNADSNVPYERAASFIFALQLSYIEVVMMTEILFGQNFFTFTEDTMSLFADFLEKLDDEHNYKGRVKAWNSALGRNRRTEIYTQTKIQFPYFFNSQKFIKKEAAKCPKPAVT